MKGAGDGDTCPLAPAHGNMLVAGSSQYCPHQSHDGLKDVAPSRKFWPLWGFEAAVTEHFERLRPLPNITMEVR